VGEDGGAASPGDTRYKEAGAGHRKGLRWLPAECDVSIRPGWFWHEKENSRVKTPQQLMDLYYRSVGRGASFLLNVPPDRRGLLHENDIASLRGFGDRLRSTFRVNLAAKARTSEGGKTLALPRPVTFNVVRLREAIRFGQRVESFELDQWKDGGWQSFGRGTSIGNCRLVHPESAVTTNRVRLRITQSPAEAIITEFGLYLDPA